MWVGPQRFHRDTTVSSCVIPSTLTGGLLWIQAALQPAAVPAQHHAADGDLIVGAEPLRAAIYVAYKSNSSKLHVLCCAADAAGGTVKSQLCKPVQGAQFQAEIARQLAEKKAAAKRKRDVAARSRSVHLPAVPPWPCTPFMHHGQTCPTILTLFMHYGHSWAGALGDRRDEEDPSYMFV